MSSVRTIEACPTLITAGNFDKELALGKRAVLDFVQKTQPNEWANLAAFYKTGTEAKFFQRLIKELDLRGILIIVNARRPKREK